MVADFKKFLMKGNVVDLAVAVVIGAAFGAVVSALVAGLITPLVGMIVSKDFSEMAFVANGSTFQYGIVINAVIAFVSVSAVIFFGVVKPMEALAKRRAAGETPADEEPAPSDEIVLLGEIRDLLSQRV